MMASSRNSSGREDIGERGIGGGEAVSSYGLGVHSCERSTELIAMNVPVLPPLAQCTRIGGSMQDDLSDAGLDEGVLLGRPGG